MNFICYRGIPSHAAPYHILVFFFFTFGAPSVTRHLAGWWVRKCLSFVHSIPLSNDWWDYRILRNCFQDSRSFDQFWLFFLFHCLCSDVCAVADAGSSHANTATAGVSFWVEKYQRQKLCFSYLQCNIEETLNEVPFKTPAMLTLSITLLTYIRDVLGSNIDWDTSYTDWGFSWLSSGRRGKLRNAEIRPRWLFFICFKIIIIKSSDDII